MLEPIVLKYDPRTYKQTHTPTVVQGGGGLMDPLGFRYVTIFRKVLTFSGKPVMCSTRLWGAAPLGASYVIKCGRQLGRHLDFTKIENLTGKGEK